MVQRADYTGFGFELMKNEKGAHQIHSVDANSPAFLGGLRKDDYLLKVNDVSVVGERYTKTIARIKNESQKGRLKLEVIEPALFKLTKLDLQPIDSSTVKSTKSGKNDVTNLKEIVSEMRSSRELGGSVNELNLSLSETKRRLSASSVPSRQRPLSVNDLNRLNQMDPKYTISSGKSFNSTTTGLSAGGILF